MSPEPASRRPHKHEQVYQALHHDIVSGRVKQGERLPSEAQLVTKFGASRITVGRALRDLQREGLIDRRAGSGTYVSPPRPQPRAKPSLLFGLLIPDLGETEILDPISQGLTSTPAARQHAVIWGSVTGTPDHKEAVAWDVCRQYIERRVAGVFFAPLELTPSKDRVNAQIVDAFDAAAIPVVLLDRSVQPYGRREQHDLVGIDNRRAGYRITEHLLIAGARRIGFVSPAHAASTVEARLAGYREALHVYDAPVEGGLILRLPPGDPALLTQLMQHQRPDAIVCVNDRTAGLVMQTLLSSGYRIPQDVRLVGIDDVQYAALLPVPLTTLRQPCREIGVAAMAAMLDRLAHSELPPRDILLHPTLVVRDSCGTRAASRSSGSDLDSCATVSQSEHPRAAVERPS
jgi:GntR family transcriptional regulator of arabinose operon